MGDVYEILESLLQERGISGGKMSADLGMSRSFMTELRKGRAKSINADTAEKIASYFGVTVDRVLGKEKTPTTKPSEQEIRAAFFEGAEDLPQEDLDALWDDARDYIQYKIQQRRHKND